MFVKLRHRKYQGGGYVSYNVAFSLDDIARVVEDYDYNFTNVITKSGEVYVIPETYQSVMKKVEEVENEVCNRD